MNFKYNPQQQINFDPMGIEDSDSLPVRVDNGNHQEQIKHQAIIKDIVQKQEDNPINRNQDKNSQKSVTEETGKSGISSEKKEQYSKVDVVIPPPQKQIQPRLGSFLKSGSQRKDPNLETIQNKQAIIFPSSILRNDPTPQIQKTEVVHSTIVPPVPQRPKETDQSVPIRQSYFNSYKEPVDYWKVTADDLGDEDGNHSEEYGDFESELKKLRKEKIIIQQQPKKKSSQFAEPTQEQLQDEQHNFIDEQLIDEDFSLHNPNENLPNHPVTPQKISASQQETPNLDKEVPSSRLKRKYVKKQQIVQETLEQQPINNKLPSFDNDLPFNLGNSQGKTSLFMYQKSILYNPKQSRIFESIIGSNTKQKQQEALQNKQRQDSNSDGEFDQILEDLRPSEFQELNSLIVQGVKESFKRTFEKLGKNEKGTGQVQEKVRVQQIEYQVKSKKEKIKEKLKVKEIEKEYENQIQIETEEQRRSREIERETQRQKQKREAQKLQEMEQLEKANKLEKQKKDREEQRLKEKKDKERRQEMERVKEIEQQKEKELQIKKQKEEREQRELAKEKLKQSKQNEKEVQMKLRLAQKQKEQQQKAKEREREQELAQEKDNEKEREKVKQRQNDISIEIEKEKEKEKKNDLSHRRNVSRLQERSRSKRTDSKEQVSYKERKEKEREREREQEVQRIKIEKEKAWASQRRDQRERERERSKQILLQKEKQKQKAKEKLMGKDKEKETDKEWDEPNVKARVKQNDKVKQKQKQVVKQQQKKSTGTESENEVDSREISQKLRSQQHDLQDKQIKKAKAMLILEENNRKIELQNKKKQQKQQIRQKGIQRKLQTQFEEDYQSQLEDNEVIGSRSYQKLEQTLKKEDDGDIEQENPVDKNNSLQDEPQNNGSSSKNQIDTKDRIGFNEIKNAIAKYQEEKIKLEVEQKDERQTKKQQKLEILQKQSQSSIIDHKRQSFRQNEHQVTQPKTPLQTDKEKKLDSSQKKKSSRKPSDNHSSKMVRVEAVMGKRIQDDEIQYLVKPWAAKKKGKADIIWLSSNQIEEDSHWVQMFETKAHQMYVELLLCQNVEKYIEAEQQGCKTFSLSNGKVQEPLLTPIKKSYKIESNVKKNQNDESAVIEVDEDLLDADNIKFIQPGLKGQDDMLVFNPSKIVKPSQQAIDSLCDLNPRQSALYLKDEIVKRIRLN